MVIQTSHWSVHECHDATKISNVIIYKTIFEQNVQGRQSAKIRQNAKPSTSWIQYFLEMIPTKYENNPFKTLWVVAFRRKVYELTKQINKQINK